MAESISLPPGAFAAMKAGTPQPPTVAKTPAVAEPIKTINRKADSASTPPQSNSPEKPDSSPEKPSETSPPSNLTPQEKKIWKLKADGEEFEFDATDEESVKREIMKARGADKRFKSAAELKQQAETFFGMLKDPASLKKVLEDPRIGVDVKKFAEELVWEQIQEAQMTEEQKAQRAKDRELDEFRNRDLTEKQKKDADAKQQRQVQYENHYEEKITQALQIGGIPKTPRTVARMADELILAMEGGLDLSAAELVAKVRTDYLSDFNTVLNAADAKLLMELLGEGNLEKVRKADLERIRSMESNPFPKRVQKTDAKSGQPKRLGASEWKEDLIKGFLARK